MLHGDFEALPKFRIFPHRRCEIIRGTEQRDFDEDYSIVAAHIQCMVTNGGKILGPRAFDTHKQEGKASNKHQVALSWSRGSIFG
jgi:hypothetical protein